MSAVERLIIADAHVGQRRDDVAAMVTMLRDAQSRGVTEIIYLGDAFQYLIGMSKFWTRSVREVMEVWRELRAEGVRIVVIEGNRDFFLDAPELASELDWTGLEYEFQQRDRRFRLVHGDRVNLRDLQYRFWSRVSKSWPARVWALLLPRRVAVAIVEAMEARLAETNQRFRYHKPLACLRRSAESLWADGADVVMWGHFHTSWVYRHDERWALILPAWLDTRCSAAIDADGRLEFVDQRLTPCSCLPRMS